MGRRVVHVVVAGALLATAVAGAGPAGASVTVSRVSGPSPFAGAECRPLDEPVWWTFDPGQGRESDPSVAVNPTNPSNVVAAWPQDGGYGIVVASSFDGGTSWARRPVAGFTRCTGGHEDHVSHARLSFGGDGRLYLTAETLDGYFPDPRSGINHVPVATSTDGGVTWSQPKIVDDLPASNGLDRIAAEPDVPGAAVVAWHTPEGAATSYLSRTTDGGQTWVKHTLPNPSAEFQPFQSVVAAPDGRLYVFFADQTLLASVGFITELFTGIDLDLRSSLFVTRSDDKGVTWSTPKLVVANVPAEWVGAVAGPDGTIYVSTWGDVDNHPALVVLRSADGGATWSSPSVAATNVLPPFPGLAIRPDGVLGVTYLTPAGDDVQAVFASSADGGLTWSQRPVAGPFPSGAYGFYQETSAGPSAFHSVFIRSGPDVDGRTDVFVARIDGS